MTSRIRSTQSYCNLGRAAALLLLSLLVLGSGCRGAAPREAGSAPTADSAKGAVSTATPAAGADGAASEGKSGEPAVQAAQGPKAQGPAVQGAEPIRFDMALSERKKGPPLPRPEVRAGSSVVLGGYIRGLSATPEGKATFRLKFRCAAGERVLSSFDNLVKDQQLDEPATGSVRMDLGVVVPSDVPPGPATYEVTIIDGSRSPVTKVFPFQVLPAAS